MLSASVAVEAPVTAVTVYSDRARVTRTATVSLSGTSRVELPLLLDGVDPDTIRVEAQGGGADIRRVDIAHVDAEAFPVDDARTLVADLEKLEDRTALLVGERDATQAVRGIVQGIAPQLPPSEPLRAPARLNATGWSSALSFVDGWLEKLQSRERDLGERLSDLDKQRQELLARGRLLGGARRRSGYRVVPTISGNGKATVLLSYMVSGARWVPTYDLQLVSDQTQVQLAFAGLLSQETGEDWVDALMTLSTAVPATATLFPKIYTWKIGEKDRFIPTPVPVSESLRPAPRAVPPATAEREDDVWRSRLMRALATGSESDYRSKNDRAPAPGKTVSADEDQSRQAYKKNRKDAELDNLLDGVGDTGGSRSRGLAPGGPGEQMDSDDAPTASSAPAPPEPEPMARAMPSAPSPVMMQSESVSAPKASPSRNFFRSGIAHGASIASSSPPPSDMLGLTPPPGYRPPYYGSDSPATLAGGYDLSYRALRPETVRSGKGARRVALFSRMLPVSVERRVFPALSPEAYLTAEIKNPSSQALPGGAANLSVGDDPAGVARLDVVAPGEKFVLPLGIDRAIKPVRNVKLVLVEKGVFSKDEISEYVVKTEIANPYRVPLALRVFDQVPLTDDKNVKIERKGSDPAPSAEDPIKGSLEWRLTIPAGGKSTLTFTYTVRRPKGWRLHQ